MAIPAAAAAAYQAAASITSTSAASGAAGITPANVGGAGSFSDFLSNAVHESIANIRAGEQAAQAGITGNANIVDVVNAVNSAELSLNTVVAVRDKVVQAYQSIMNMPI